MNNPDKISHEEIRDFIEGALTPSQLERIREIRIREPAYDFLFGVIESYVGKVPKSVKADKNSVDSSYSAMDELVMKLMSGSLKKSRAKALIGKIWRSRLFYERLMVKLGQITPTAQPEELPELEKIRIKSEDEILTELGIISSAQKMSRSRRISGIQELWNKLRLVTTGPGYVPRYVFALPLIITISIVTVLWLGKSDKRLEIDYVYDTRVPYEYDQPIWRDTAADDSVNPVMNVFISQFRLGVSAYTTYDYGLAANIFEPLNAAAKDTIITLLPSLTRDLFFYQGLSHIALATSQKRKLPSDLKSQHVASAIGYLTLASEVESNHHLGGDDREKYFLGLAFGLAGSVESALAQLRAIEPTSPFHEDSQILIRKIFK